MIADNLYSESGGLLGSQCQQCDEAFFPQVTSCANCSSEDIRQLSLGHRGRLWSWTVQRFRPKPPYKDDKGPEEFEPYGVALVETDCGLLIKSRLRLGSRPPAIGDRLQLEVSPFRQEGGRTLSMLEFRQVDE